MEPLACPICTRFNLRRLLDDFTINATSKNGTHEVGGLATYECRDNGHIFFVRVSDIEAPTRSHLWSKGEPEADSKPEHCSLAA